MLQNKELLKKSKNLLAFSAGVDSTALLFLLREHKIVFDIAIVDYGLREQSKEELAYAKELSQKYNFVCHTYKAVKIENNFEAEARKIRYDFFSSLIKQHHYDNLLTAHHLGDRFEWMLMQFCKGAGTLELSGMQALEKREHFTLLRPLLHLEKNQLLEYLKKNSIKYFEDASNTDEKYQRNYFRQNHATPLLHKYSSGIERSFQYLDADRNLLAKELKIKKINTFSYFIAAQNRSNILTLDRYFKSLGKMLSANERELLKKEETTLIARKYVVAYHKQFVFIAPYMPNLKIEKKLKERLRLLKLEPKLRGYLSTDLEAVELLSLLLQ